MIRRLSQTNPIPIVGDQKPLGSALFSETARRLYRGGSTPLLVSPQRAQALAFFLRNRGRAVTRGEIEFEIWGKSPPEDSFNQLIKGLRNILKGIDGVSLIREKAGHYRLVEPAAPAPQTNWAPSMEIYPSTRLLDPDLSVFGAPDPNMELYVAAPQPLELRAAYASAAQRQLVAGARITYFVPETEASVLALVLNNLVAIVDSKPLAPSEIEERLRRLQFRARFVLTPAGSVVTDLRIYKAFIQNEAVAISKPPHLDEFNVYARGGDATHLASELKKWIPNETPNAVIMVARGVSESSIEGLKQALSWQFARYGLEVDVPWPPVH